MFYLATRHDNNHHPSREQGWRECNLPQALLSEEANMRTANSVWGFSRQTTPVVREMWRRRSVVRDDSIIASRVYKRAMQRSTAAEPAAAVLVKLLLGGCVSVKVAEVNNRRGNVVKCAIARVVPSTRTNQTAIIMIGMHISVVFNYSSVAAVCLQRDSFIIAANLSIAD